MEHKTLAGLRLKADDGQGRGQAVFSTFNVIDSDQDVTRPGAFEDGAEVVMSSFGHGSWQGMLPVGKGRIRAERDRAIFDFEIFDTSAGRDTRTVLRELGPLSEWSYGYDPVEFSFGEHNGQQVRFLDKVEVFEVSPVLKGAGVGTTLLTIKGRNQGLSAADLAVIERARAYVAEYEAEQHEIVRQIFEKFKASEQSRSLDRLAVDASEVMGHTMTVVDARSVPAETRRAAEAATKEAARQLRIRPPKVRWFTQPGELTLWGRALIADRLVYVNEAAGPHDAIITAAHEVAHLTGRDEAECLRYEREFFERIFQ